MPGKNVPTDKLVTEDLKKLIELSSKLIVKDTLTGNLIQWQDFSQASSSMVEMLPLHTVISLHFHQILYPLLKAVHLLWKSSKIEELSKKCIGEIKNVMQCIYENSYEYFLKKEEKAQKKEYSTLILEMIKQKIIVVKEISQQYMLAKDSRTLVIRHLLNRLYDLTTKRSQEASHKARGELNSFIEKELLVQDAHSLLQQVVLNWIKQKTQIIQSEPKQYICCKIHFEHQANSNMSGFSEGADQEFKDYRWPLQNQSIKFHLTKTIVGYLNTLGGIIYVGMKQDKNKMVLVNGIKLTKHQRLDFLYFIYDDILKGVHPKEPQRIAYEQQQAKILQKQQNNTYLLQKIKRQQLSKLQQQEMLKKYPFIYKLKHQFTKNKSQGYQYRITKYITIDFLDVYAKQSNLNVGQKGDRLYIVRIKIKAGDPKELYHLINKNHIPETYIRSQKAVKKQTLTEFYKQFQKRISGLTVKQRKNQKNEKHAYCRFQALQNTQNKKQEIKEQ